LGSATTYLACCDAAGVTPKAEIDKAIAHILKPLDRVGSSTTPLIVFIAVLLSSPFHLLARPEARRAGAQEAPLPPKLRLPATAPSMRPKTPTGSSAGVMASASAHTPAVPPG